MKRQAEEQLIKGGTEDSDSPDEETGEQGMKRASETEISRRTIRPLPSRSKPVQGAFTMPTLPSGSSPFANPFGAKPDAAAGAAPPSSSFTGFTPKATSDTSSSINTDPTPSIFSGFGSKPAATESTRNSFSSNAFSLPSTTLSSSGFSTKSLSAPSDASRTFASLLNNSKAPTSPPSITTPTGAQSFSSSAGKSAEESNTVKYYKNLRGLNASFLSSLTEFVQDDPFVNLTEVVEKYKTFRSKVQAEYDESPSTTKSSPPATTSPPTNERPAAMPTPPPTFSGFGGFKLPPASSPSGTSTTSSNGPGSGGFKPSPSSFGASITPSPFSLPTDSKNTAFSFGSTIASSTASSPTPPTAPFTFGSSSSATAMTPAFGSFGSNSTKTDDASSTAASSNPFGLTPSSSTSTFTFGKPVEKSASNTANPFSVPEKSTSVPNFFSLPTTTKVPTDGSVFGSGNSPSGNIFAKSETKPATDDNTEGEGSERDTPAAEGEPITPNPLAVNPLDEEGAGEENEETVHTVKAKAFKLSKDGEGVSKWLQLGTGMLRLKKDKDTEGRRVLLRNSTNGKVIVNFKVYSGLKPTQNKSALSFVGHEDGLPVTYSIRVANENDAKTLKEALDREIAGVKAI